MENVGAVTWNDALIKPRDQQTAEVTSFVQFVALHELAHMWFGDLVTM
jgi:aminopeptidase N